MAKRTYEQSKMELYRLMDKIIAKIDNNTGLNPVAIYLIAGSEFGFSQLTCNKRLLILEEANVITIDKEGDKFVNIKRVE